MPARQNYRQQTITENAFKKITYFNNVMFYTEKVLFIFF
jgi:hypothetical protein